MRGGQRGVTLVEVVVVLLVLSILMGGAAPTVGAALEGYRAGARRPISTRRFISRKPARAPRT